VRASPPSRGPSSSSASNRSSFSRSNVVRGSTADKERAVALKGELIQAFRLLCLPEMSRQLAPDDKEKAAIAALLGNVAKLLLVMIDLDRFREISRRVVDGATEASAAQDVLGMSLQTLTNEVLISWGILTRSCRSGTGTITPADAKKIHRLDRIVALAKTTAQHLRHRHGAERDALIADVRRQCVADSGVTARCSIVWVSAADARCAGPRFARGCDP